MSSKQQKEVKPKTMLTKPQHTPLYLPQLIRSDKSNIFRNAVVEKLKLLKKKI